VCVCASAIVLLLDLTCQEWESLSKFVVMILRGLQIVYCDASCSSHIDSQDDHINYQERGILPHGTCISSTTIHSNPMPINNN
jgi:hypothetical protein